MSKATKDVKEAMRNKNLKSYTPIQNLNSGKKGKRHIENFHKQNEYVAMEIIKRICSYGDSKFLQAH